MSRLAADVDLSPGRMSRIVNGHVRPSIEAALRIAELTDGAVSLEELLGLEGRIPACVRLRAADPQVEPPAPSNSSTVGRPPAAARPIAPARHPPGSSPLESNGDDFLDTIECEKSGVDPHDPVARAEARRRRLARVGRAA